MNLNFIEPETGMIDRTEYQRASYLRKSFQIDGKVKSAKLFMTALGTYVGYLNGQRLGREMQRPGFTDYFKRLQYQEYDATDMLAPGENVIGAVLGDGWYRGTLGGDEKYFYGEKTALAARLEVTYASGETQTVCTDDTWRATQNGAVGLNDQKVVEEVDMTMDMGGWNEPGFSEDSHWHGCAPSSYGGRLIPQEGEPLVELERLSCRVIVTPNGDTVLDFGQNHCGHVEFTVTGHAGTAVSLIMGETLDENGNFTIKNITPANMKKPVDWQRLNYVLKEGSQTYKSMFLMSGYRYVKLENWPEPVKAENFTSVVIGSELERTGEFSCSNDDINQLVSNVIWSQKSNFVEIPTDCPQRERAGWSGDINVFCETANYLMRADRFLDKWLNDFVSVAEGKNGFLPYVVPCIPMAGDTTNGSAGWADAVAAVPDMLYRFYGDKSVLEKVYPTIVEYVEFNRQRAKKKNFRHFYKSGAHYDYILDTGYHYGEWMEPGSNLMLDGVKGMIAPDEEVATAWWFYTTDMLSKIAGILEKTGDEKKYRELADNIRRAYQKEFFKNGAVHSDRMCRYVRPLYMGLAGKHAAAEIAKKLNDMCVANGYKIGTGFLTTYKLLPVLTEYGYAETAYKVLLNEAYPGWMYAVKHGATTIWENWKGIDENGAPHDSLNHYSAGSVVSWLFAYCAGIRPAAPGFDKILIKPVPGEPLTWVRASYDSIQGRISVFWEKYGEDFRLSAEIPEGACAEIVLPDGSSSEVTGGKYDYSCKC